MRTHLGVFAEGNKSRLLSTISSFSAHKKISKFVDICCNEVSVGLNVNAEYVVYFDNKKVLELYKLLASSLKN
jgi:hypothetical protein